MAETPTTVQSRHPGTNSKHCLQRLSQRHYPFTGMFPSIHPIQTVSLVHEVHVLGHTTHCPLSIYVGGAQTPQIMSKLFVLGMQLVHPG